MGSRKSVPLVLVGFGLTAALVGQDPDQSPLGLKNRWYAAGGSASRSGAVATEPLDEPPERAWQFEAPGAIVGEPLVWDDVVVFETELPKDKRRLQVLDLATGAEIVHRDFFPKDAEGGLAPTLWNREVVVRAGDKLKRYRFGQEGISEQRASGKVNRLGAPLRIDDAIYLLVDGGVERWSASGLESEWRSADSGYRGGIAVAGSSVFAVRVTGGGGGRYQGEPAQGELVQLDRGRGVRRASANLPLVPSGDPMLAVGDFAIFVRDIGTMMLRDGNSVDALHYPLPFRGPDVPPLLATMPAAPAIGSEFWIGGCGTMAEPMLGLGKPDTNQFTVLATKVAHDYLLASPITLAGNLAYVGGTAVDVDTLEVRWRIDAPPGARAIAARDTLLFASGTAITAFRRPGAEAAAATLAKTREWEAVCEEAQHAELCAVVEDAMAGLELDLVDDLLRRCRAHGVDEKWVANQARLRKSKSRLRPKKDPERLAALERRAADVDAVARTAIWQQLESSVGDDRDDRLRALRFMFDLDPTFPVLAAKVVELVPEGLRPTGTFDVGEWLGFAESTRAIPIDFLPVVAEADIGEATPDQLKLLELRATWRKDLVAVQSPRLLVYTPVEAPGSLARCLSLGELVCDTLEALFVDYPVVRQDPRRMRILLYPTKDEYKKFSPGGGHLAWTAGHYSAQEELSRMFLPKDKQAFTRVMSVFVHEITHQWLQDRCPAIDAGLAFRRKSPDQAAYWLVEGIASFVEEFAFDLEMRTFRTDSPRDENLDILANADPRMLLAWGDLLKLSPLDFQRISPVPAHGVKLGYRLGMERKLSPRNFFYAQSGALCHWLWHAESGAHRKALLDFVLAHYHGEVDKLDLAKNLGMTADAIGAAVVGYAVARRP